MAVTSETLQGVATILAVMNPISSAPIFQNMVSPLEPARQRSAAFLALLVMGIVLVCAALAGAFLLDLFGISIDAFRAAGGLLIGLMGFEMVRGNKSKEHERLAHEHEIREQILVPFAVPIVAGPGTIATVITLAAGSSGTVPWVAFAAISVGLAATAGCLFGVLVFGRYLSTDAQRIFTRFMGLILMAMGMQFLLAGAGAVMERGAETVLEQPAPVVTPGAVPEPGPVTETRGVG